MDSYLCEIWYLNTVPESSDQHFYKAFLQCDTKVANCQCTFIHPV